MKLLKYWTLFESLLYCSKPTHLPTLLPPSFILKETPLELWNVHKDEDFHSIPTFCTVTVQTFIAFPPLSDFCIGVYRVECWQPEWRSQLKEWGGAQMSPSFLQSSLMAQWAFKLLEHSPTAALSSIKLRWKLSGDRQTHSFSDLLDIKSTLAISYLLQCPLMAYDSLPLVLQQDYPGTMRVDTGNRLDQVLGGLPPTCPVG